MDEYSRRSLRNVFVDVVFLAVFCVSIIFGDGLHYLKENVSIESVKNELVENQQK